MTCIPEQVGLAAYRIAEEALTNVVEHAKASKVTVRLDSSREGWLRLTVRDDGQGFDVESPPTGWGWEQCKTTLRPWMESVRSTAIQAWARRLRPCSRSSPPGAEQSRVFGKRRQLMEMLKETCPWCHKEVQVEAGRERRYTCSSCKKEFTYTPGPDAGEGKVAGPASLR